ncbi:MAG: hypothetical protein U0694_07990 [Anaerolineae bacterium]
MLSLTLRRRIGFVLLCVLLLGVFAPMASAQGSGRLLVWLANGLDPNQVDANAPGQLVWMNADGTTSPLMDVPAPANRVLPCGDTPTSPGGNMFLFYMGMDEGTLYAIRGSDAPVALDSVRAFVCLGSGTLRFSPDGARIAYIDSAAPSDTDEFAEGTLRILDTAGLEPAPFREADVDSTVAFDLNNDQAAFIRFFTNSNGEATEASVNLWDGSTVREVTSLRPEADNNCRFTSASIVILPDGRLISVMGHRCQSGGDTGTHWKFYVIDPNTRTTEETLSEAQPGQFSPLARTNNLYISPDGARLYFTIPDGVTLNTVSLRQVNLADMSPSELISRSAVMARDSNRPYDWGTSAFPVQSRDGRWLAIARNTPDNDSFVDIMDFNAASAPPFELSAGDRGAIVGALAFTTDSRRLIYVVGGTGGNDNSLFAFDLDGGSEFRISRGRFGDMAVSPDSTQVAIMEWQTVDDPQEPAYLTLALIDVNSSAYTPVFVGADVADGHVTNPRFAYPLVWRP